MSTAGPAIGAAWVAAMKMRENMYGSSGSSGLSYKDRQILATNNALLQCQDLSDVPTVTEYIYTNTNGKARISKNCYNCEYSKMFYHIDEDFKLVCLKKLIDLSFDDSVVDDEHICLLHEYEQHNCCCCNKGE